MFFFLRDQDIFFHEIPVDIFSFLFSLNLNEHLTFIGCGKQEGLQLQGLLRRSKQAGTAHLSHLIGVSHLKEGNPQLFGHLPLGLLEIQHLHTELTSTFPQGAWISICQVFPQNPVFQVLDQAVMLFSIYLLNLRDQKATPLSMLRSSTETRASLHPFAVWLKRGKGQKLGAVTQWHHAQNAMFPKFFPSGLNDRYS